MICGTCGVRDHGKSKNDTLLKPKNEAKSMELDGKPLVNACKTWCFGWSFYIGPKTAIHSCILAISACVGFRESPKQQSDTLFFSKNEAKSSHSRMRHPKTSKSLGKHWFPWLPQAREIHRFLWIPMGSYRFLSIPMGKPRKPMDSYENTYRRDLFWGHLGPIGPMDSDGKAKETYGFL